jgi:spore germination cell wall hydrolase CwlJ-like protein
MKTILAAAVLGIYAGSASAIWTEKPGDAGVNVNHCFKPGVKFVNECLNSALKKVKVQQPKAPVKKVEPKKIEPKKVVAKKSFAITDSDIKDDGQPLAFTDTKDIKCLAYSIFREAGNQKEKDQYAVGQVHMNRLKEGSWGKTMCKVVFAKAQFSWTLESKKVAWSKRQEEHFMQIAEGLMIDGFHVKRLASDKILHYHATYVKPKWAKQGKMVASAGDHVFYKNVPY